MNYAKQEYSLQIKDTIRPCMCPPNSCVHACMSRFFPEDSMVRALVLGHALAKQRTGNMLNR